MAKGAKEIQKATLTCLGCEEEFELAVPAGKRAAPVPEPLCSEGCRAWWEAEGKYLALLDEEREAISVLLKEGS